MDIEKVLVVWIKERGKEEHKCKSNTRSEKERICKGEEECILAHSAHYCCCLPHFPAWPYNSLKALPYSSLNLQAVAHGNVIHWKTGLQSTVLPCNSPMRYYCPYFRNKGNRRWRRLNSLPKATVWSRHSVSGLCDSWALEQHLQARLSRCSVNVCWVFLKKWRVGVRKISPRRWHQAKSWSKIWIWWNGRGVVSIQAKGTIS